MTTEAQDASANATELKNQKLLKKFLSSMASAKITTSSGKEIALAVDSLDPHPEIRDFAARSEKGYIISYQDYPNYSTEDKFHNGNYLLIFAQLKKRLIKLGSFNFTHADLKEQGAFEETLKVIGQNFPKNFVFNSGVERQDNAAAKFVELKKQFQTHPEVTEARIKHILLYPLTKAGFNDFIIYPDELGYPQIDAKIKSKQKTVTLKIA